MDFIVLLHLRFIKEFYVNKSHYNEYELEAYYILIIRISLNILINLVCKVIYTLVYFFFCAKNNWKFIVLKVYKIKTNICAKQVKIYQMPLLGDLNKT